MTGPKPIRDTPATSIIIMRVTPEDKAQLVAIAASQGMSLTRYLVDGGLDTHAVDAGWGDLST